MSDAKGKCLGTPRCHGQSPREHVPACPHFHDGDLMLAVLDWVLEEQIAGRRPNDEDVAGHFDITIEKATAIHDRLEKMGEFE